jgi:hypothetical protein
VESDAINQYIEHAIYMVIAYNKDISDGFWGRSQATLHMSTIESGILGPFVIPTRGVHDPELYWFIGCFYGSSMETFQRFDGVYSSYPPTDACFHLFPGPGLSD